MYDRFTGDLCTAIDGGSAGDNPFQGYEKFPRSDVVKAAQTWKTKMSISLFFTWYVTLNEPTRSADGPACDQRAFGICINPSSRTPP